MLTWGDATSKIENGLVLRGLTSAEAQQILTELTAERYADFRQQGAIQVAIGIVMIAAGAAYYALRLASVEIAFRGDLLLVIVGVVGRAFVVLRGLSG